MTLDLGILLALGCAFVANLAFFLKYRGANEVAKVQVLHPWRSARALYSSKWFALALVTRANRMRPILVPTACAAMTTKVLPAAPRPPAY